MKRNEIGTKKESKFYSIDEILGNEFEIVEDIRPDTEIRKHKTKDGNYEYFDILIKYIEEKDLSMRYTPLEKISMALPANESWKGYKLKINRTGSGKNLTYTVTILGKTLEKALEKPQDAQTPAQVDKVKATLDKIAGYTKMQMSVNDAGLEYIANEVCGTKESGQFMIVMLKASGKIVQNAQGWVVT